MMSLSQSLQKRPAYSGIASVNAQDAEVVLAVGGRDVDETDAVVGRHIAVVQDDERSVGLLVREVREDRLVGRALELVALELGDDFVLVLLLEDVGKAGLRHDVDRPRVIRHVPHCHIVDVSARADREVLGKRPRSSRPDEEIDGRLLRKERFHLVARAGERLGTHGDGRILDVLVVRAGLEVGERRRKLPGIRHDAVRLVDAALVPELLEDPPDGLHEAEVHRLVVVVEVDPAAHARDGLAPFTDVLEHHRAALLVELVDAKLLDLGSPRDAKRFLGERLDREAVGIPAETALDVLAAHRLVTRNDVLDRTGEQVSVVGKPRGERRPVVELVALLAFVFLQ